MLSISLALLGTGCASVEIPNVKIYREIPFIDGAEAVFLETVTHKTGSLTVEQWAELRPYMIMIEPEGWSAIKGVSYKACRTAGEKCNVKVDSVDQLLKRLDSIARVAFGPK